MTIQPPCRTNLEPARETRVVRGADVVVVGGGHLGPASARSGAKTVLIERYGRPVGMATGGLVNIYPNLSDSGEAPNGRLVKPRAQVRVQRGDWLFLG